MQRRRVPTHFFVGTLLLYAVVLGTFLLTASPLYYAIPNWRTIVPIGAGFSFYIAANLFLLILGRGHVSRWTVLKTTGVTLILTILLVIALRSQMLYERVGPDAKSLRTALAGVRDVVRTALSPSGVGTQSLQFAGMIALEEAVKLLPVFVLIWRRRIRSAHAAMLCGALSGLAFGTIEAISYGCMIYPFHPPGGSPLTTYLTRFFIMSPLHGIWDALACGLVFFLSGSAESDDATHQARPMLGAFFAAYACAVVMHVLHNALQQIIGPEMQIASVFALLAPLYITAKIARRRAALEGQPDGGQLVGDLHILTISLATLFLAASVTFFWAFGYRAPALTNTQSASLTLD